MIILQAKDFMRPEDLAAYRAQLLRQAAEGFMVVPATFEVIYNSDKKQAVVVANKEGQICTG